MPKLSNNRRSSSTSKSDKRRSSVLCIVLLSMFVLLATQFTIQNDQRNVLAAGIMDAVGNLSNLSWNDFMAVDNTVVGGLGNNNSGDETTTTEATTKKTTSSLSLLQLSKESAANHQAHYNCSWPFVPIYDRIVGGTHDDIPFAISSYENGTRKIPRIVHIAWVHDDPIGPNKGRCLHYQQALTIDKWKAALPNYSIIFHDDYMVGTLMQQEFWPEFPELARILDCVKMRNAMLIDIWRVLVLYRFGGLYADMDVMPTEIFTEDIVPAEADFFSFSDEWNRPSQWCWAISPGHPVGYFTMLEILKRLLDMENIASPALVFTTGPDALKHGYGRAFYWKKDIIFNDGIHRGMYNSTARKIGNPVGNAYHTTNINDIQVFNATHNWTVRDEIKAESGTVHWLDEKANLKHKVDQGGPCRDYLYQLERQKDRFPGKAWMNRRLR